MTPYGHIIFAAQHRLKQLRQFERAALGGSRDYLEHLADDIHIKAESITEEQINAVYDVETWPL